MSGGDPNNGLPSPGDIAHDRDSHGQHATNDRGSVHGQQPGNSPPLPSPGDIANDRVSEQQFAEQKKTWVEIELERRQKGTQGDAENDQNERGRGRSLPDDQQNDRGGRGGR